MSVRVCSPSRSSRFSRLRSVAGLATVLATLGLTACAQETPEQKAYQQALQTAQTDPDFCYSNRYDGVLAQAWQRAHDANADTQQDKATGTPTPTPSVVVTGATVMPELSVPPYSQRSCRLSVKVGDAAPETGFLTFTYLVRNAITESALAEWHPDKEVVQKYDATMQQIKSGLDMNDPDLKACIARYPALQPNTTDPMVQKAAFDVRAHLVRRCLANKAALKNLYSDLYFIHR